MSEHVPESSETQRRFEDGHWWQWDGSRWVMEPAPPTGDPAFTPPEVEAPLPGKSRRGLWIGLAAVAAVIFVGLAVTFVVGRASAARVMQDTATTCDLALASGAVVGDDGATLTLDGKGAEESTGLDITQIACVLFALKTPDAVVAQIDGTRSLDGRQSATWGDVSASWTYHPDNGLDMILTTKTN